VQKVIDTVNDQPNVLWRFPRKAPIVRAGAGHMIDLIILTKRQALSTLSVYLGITTRCGAV